MHGVPADCQMTSHFAMDRTKRHPSNRLLKKSRRQKTLHGANASRVERLRFVTGRTINYDRAGHTSIITSDQTFLKWTRVYHSDNNASPCSLENLSEILLLYPRPILKNQIKVLTWFTL